MSRFTKLLARLFVETAPPGCGELIETPDVEIAGLLVKGGRPIPCGSPWKVGNALCPKCGEKARTAGREEKRP